MVCFYQYPAKTQIKIPMHICFLYPALFLVYPKSFFSEFFKNLNSMHSMCPFSSSCLLLFGQYASLLPWNYLNCRLETSEYLLWFNYVGGPDGQSCSVWLTPIYFFATWSVDGCFFPSHMWREQKPHSQFKSIKYNLACSANSGDWLDWLLGETAFLLLLYLL